MLQSYLAALLSPFMFLSYGMVTGHAVQALSDSVALCLSFAGFLVAFRFRARRGFLLLAAFIMILGFYYKPQYVGLVRTRVVLLIPMDHFLQPRVLASFSRLPDGAFVLASVRASPVRLRDYAVFPSHRGTGVSSHLPRQNAQLLPVFLTAARVGVLLQGGKRSSL